VQTGGGTVEDIVWGYLTPLPAVAEIAERLCFFSERVEVELRVDGVLVDRPETEWSHGVDSPTQT
jgi:uncharacterized protein (DUF427 family)